MLQAWAQQVPELVARGSPYPFVFGPAALPAASPNGACKFNKTVAPDIVKGNDAALSEVLVAFSRGDYSQLPQLYENFNAVVVLEMVTPAALRKVLEIFMCINNRWMMKPWHLHYAPGAYRFPSADGSDAHASPGGAPLHWGPPGPPPPAAAGPSSPGGKAAVSMEMASPPKPLPPSQKQPVAKAVAFDEPRTVAASPRATSLAESMQHGAVHLGDPVSAMTTFTGVGGTPAGTIYISMPPDPKSPLANEFPPAASTAMEAQRFIHSINHVVRGFDDFVARSEIEKQCEAAAKTLCTSLIEGRAGMVHHGLYLLLRVEYAVGVAIDR